MVFRSGARILRQGCDAIASLTLIDAAKSLRPLMRFVRVGAW